MSGDKTEKASAKKRKKAGDQGDRLMSRETMAAGAMLAGVHALGSVAISWTAGWQRGFDDSVEPCIPWRQSDSRAAVCERAFYMYRHDAADSECLLRGGGGGNGDRTAAGRRSDQVDGDRT